MTGVCRLGGLSGRQFISGCCFHRPGYPGDRYGGVPASSLPRKSSVGGLPSFSHFTSCLDLSAPSCCGSLEAADTSPVKASPMCTSRQRAVFDGVEYPGSSPGCRRVVSPDLRRRTPGHRGIYPRSNLPLLPPFLLFWANFLIPPILLTYFISSWTSVSGVS